MGVSVIESWTKSTAAPDAVRLIYQASSGDQWLLAASLGEDPFIMHVSNAASGGHTSRTSVSAFLAGPRRAEVDALLKMIGTLVEAAQASERAS